jgi:hypothetical protein
MAGKSPAAETPDATAATGTPEPAAAPVESAGNDNVMKELEEARANLLALQVSIEKTTKEKNDAIAAALRADAQYRGLQNQTTKTLQRAAEDRRALAVAQMQAQEIGDIKTMLNTLVGQVLDEESAKAYQWNQRELELKRREAAVQAALTAPAETEATPQYNTTPVDEKAQFLSYYFPGVDVDPNDPNIDWGAGAESTPEAFRRFTTSVLKIRDQKEATKANDAAAVAQAQIKEQLAAIQKQQEELATKTAQEIEAAKTAATEEARKEAEKRLRALGADVSGTPPPDGSGTKTFGQQLEEALDDNLLRTKKGQEEYSRRVEAMKKQARERYR